MGSWGSRRTFRLFRVLPPSLPPSPPSDYLASPIFWCFRSVLHLPTYRALCTQSEPEKCKHDFLIFSRFPCLDFAAFLHFSFFFLLLFLFFPKQFQFVLGLTPSIAVVCVWGIKERTETEKGRGRRIWGLGGVAGSYSGASWLSRRRVFWALSGIGNIG